MSQAVTFIDDRISESYEESVNLQQRKRNFGDQIVFHAPGLKKYRTTEYDCHDASEFVAVSVTGEACSLNCEHCKTGVLKGMHDLPSANQSLYELCSRLQLSLIHISEPTRPY